MHARRCMSLLLTTAGILACCAVGFAQPSYGISVGGVVAGAIGCGEHTPPLPTFTASWKTTTVQKHELGLVVTNVRTLKAAWDSAGRVFNETHSTAWNNGNPGSPDITFTDVSDPLRQVIMKWNSGSREAVILHAPKPSQAPIEESQRSAALESDCRQVPPRLPPPPAESVVEQLGPKTIHGMEATGTHFSVVTPAQPETNKPGITAIEESWISRDYGVEVLRIVRYPNGGYEKSELVSFEDGSPDPSLFEIPEGYAVRDVYQEAPQQK